MEEKKICPYCGGEILAVAKKCKHCGKWLTESEVKPQQYRNTYRENSPSVNSENGMNRKNRLILAIVVFVIVFCLLQLMWYGRN
jgi:uncharacterized membrane protein YvbJ